MATFTYVPSYNSSLDESPHTLDAKFGDGYEQSRHAGINTLNRNFKLSFNNITQAAATAIIDFFKTNDSAIVPFDWTPPDGVAGRFKCKKYNTLYIGGDIVSVSCDFEEVHW